MSSPVLQPGFRLPFNVDGKADAAVVEALRWHDNGIVDLNQAVRALKSQIKAITTPAAGTSTTTTVTNTITIESILSGLGTVNDQTGQTAYTLINTDAGTLLILNDASPVAVTLNSSVATPFALFITNFGVGTATLTPSLGLINGGASLSLLQNQTVWIVFDGTNWETTALIASINFADNETVTLTAGVGTLAHTPNPTGSLVLVQTLTSFGGVVLINGTNYTLSGATITITSGGGGITPATVKAWYRY